MLFMEDILSEAYNVAADWYKENGFYDEARIIIEKIDMDLMFSGDMKKIYDWCMAIPKEKYKNVDEKYLIKIIPQRTMWK